MLTRICRDFTRTEKRNMQAIEPSVENASRRRLYIAIPKYLNIRYNSSESYFEDTIEEHSSLLIRCI